MRSTQSPGFASHPPTPDGEQGRADSKQPWSPSGLPPARSLPSAPALQSRSRNPRRSFEFAAPHFFQSGGERITAAAPHPLRLRLSPVSLRPPTPLRLLESLPNPSAFAPVLHASQLIAE